MDRRSIDAGIEQLEERFGRKYLDQERSNIHHFVHRLQITLAEWPDVLGRLKQFHELPPADAFWTVLEDLRKRNLNARNREARAWAIHQHEVLGNEISLGWLKKIYGGEENIPPRGCRTPLGEEVPF